MTKIYASFKLIVAHLSACASALIILMACNTSYAQTSWTQVPSPDSSATRTMLRGISGTSSSNIWVVGNFEEAFAQYVPQKNLIMNWDGNGWSVASPFNPSLTQNELWDVEAISDTNIWIAGAYDNYGTVQSQLLHSSGSGWSQYSLPIIAGGSFLHSIDAISATDIWAVGGKGGSPTRPCYTVHYNGSSWSEVPVPPVGAYMNNFNAVDGISANDVWAVGNFQPLRAHYRYLAMHWDGSSWAHVPLPTGIDSLLGELFYVKMVAHNDVWVIGGTLTGQTTTLHWNGTGWTEHPHTGGEGAIVASAGDIFTFGSRIAHFDGTVWSIEDSLSQLSNPALASAIAFAGGDIWAAGRTIDSGGVYHTLVYRNVLAIPAFARGGSQQAAAVSGSATSLDSLLATSDADEAQILHYSTDNQPLHGSLTGLPASAIAHNGMAYPSGIVYTPSASYAGLDSFTIRVSVGGVWSKATIVVNVQNSLPVTITEFSVTAYEKQGNLVKWATLAETNTDHFVVQHSTNGANYKNVATVGATGTLSGGQAIYKAWHHDPANGWNYYRLTSIDKDGKSATFPVKAIYTGNNNQQQLFIFPNPSNGRLIQISANSRYEGRYTVAIYNQQAQRVFSSLAALQNGMGKINISSVALLAGVYYLVLENDNHERLTTTLVIAK